jgi:hypothetical protein
MLKHKSNIWIVLLLIVCPIIIYWQIGLFQFTLKWDMMDQYFPFRYFIGECVSNGVMPWWNPYLNLGYPLHADPQSGFWYPVTWLLGLNGYSLYDLHLEFMLHIVVAGFGFYFLLRAQHVSRTTALIFALCYEACGFFVGNAQHFTYIIGAGYLPWIFLCFQQVIIKQQLKYVTALALLLSLLLTGGYPALFIISCYLLGLYLLFWFFQNKVWQQKELLAQVFKLFFFCGILFGLIVSGYIVSFTEAKDLFTRGEGVTAEKSLYMPFSPKAIISLLLPVATALKPSAFGSDISMINVYSGLMALLFFPVGLVAKWQQKYFWLLAGGICLLASFGEFTPVRLWLYHYVPLMNSFRFPSVFRIFFIISLLLIAAHGLDYFLKQNKPSILITKVVVVAALAITTLITLLLLIKSSGFQVVPFWNFQQYQNIIAEGKITGGILFQAIIQLLLLLCFAIILFSSNLKKYKYALVALVAIDLFFATQLNINGSAVCERKVSDYQNALNLSPKKFPNSKDAALINLKVLDKAYYPSWSNNAVFLKAVSEQGYNPFQLKAFEQYEQSADRYITLDNALFYFKHSNKDAAAQKHNNTVEVLKMQPGLLEANIAATQKDTLYLLQTYYPNWQVTVNNELTEIIKCANGLMAVAVNNTSSHVVFKYNAGKLYWLLCLQFALQAVVLAYIFYIATNYIFKKL